MKKIITATALIVALSIPGLALANAPKVGDKLSLCEKQGVYTLLGAKEKCEGSKVDGKLGAIKDGKLEVDVKGKKVMIDQPKATQSKAAPAALKTSQAKAAVTAPAKPASDKTVTPAAPEKK
ncbi:MAG: hypothetical protein V1806_07905 [Pseudomonadota bacterium]